MLIYIFIVFCALLFSYIAQKKNKFKYLLISILLLSGLLGFRGTNVGIDTGNYYEMFENIANNEYAYSKDYGFLIVTKFLLSINGNVLFPMFVYSFVINFFILARLWDFKESASLSLMFFLYISLFYFASFNIFRQYIAISLCFWASRYIKQKRIWVFFLYVFLAAMIHLSAIVSIGLFYLSIVNKKNKTKKERNFLILSVVLATPVIIIFVKLNFYKYSSYFELSNLHLVFNPMLLVQLILVWFFNFMFEKSTYNDTLEMKNITVFFIFGIIMVMLGSLFTYFERIGLYFQIFGLIYWGYICKNNRYRGYAFIFCCLIAFYYIVMQFIGNGQGIFPYYTYWN